MDRDKLKQLTINVSETGANIRRIRMEQGITVAEIQEVMGFREPRTIYKWQSGAMLPTLDNIVKLAVLFDVPIERILILNCG